MSVVKHNYRIKVTKSPFFDNVYRIYITTIVGQNNEVCTEIICVEPGACDTSAIFFVVKQGIKNHIFLVTL